VILVLLLVLILFIRSPWGQGIIVDKVTKYVSEKTGTEVAVQRLFITFTGNIFLEELYLEDTNGDTLLYSQKLETGVAFMPLLTSGNINVSKVEWENAVARVNRTEASGKFNFDFLIEAFTSPPGENPPDQTPVDTTSAPLTISLGPISLKNIDAIYKDEVLGIDGFLKLGLLEAKIPTIDMEAFEFEISELSLENTQGYYLQTKPFEPTEEDTTSSPLPSVSVDELLINSVRLDYISVPDKMTASLNIGEINVELPEANLQEQIVRLDRIAIRDSKILYHDFSLPDSSVVVSPEAEAAPFTWPDWDVKADEITIITTDIEYKTKDIPIQKGYFNPEAIQLSAITIDLENIFLKQEEAGIELNKVEFEEGSGFSLREFSTSISLGDEKIEIGDLRLQTNRSRLFGDATVNYNSIQELMESPDKSEMNLNIKELRAEVKDSYFFAPDLEKDTLIQEIAKSPVLLIAKANGSLASLNIPKLDAKWGDTELVTHGTISNPTEIDLLTFDFPEIQASTTRKTIIKFIDESSLGIQLPENMNLTATAKGKMDDALANLSLETDFGNIKLDGSFQNKESIAFDTELDISTLQLGKILQNEELDTLSGKLVAKGEGSNLNDLNATLTSSFTQLGIYGHDYSGLELEGKLENGAGDIHLWIEEEFLDFDLLSKLDLDSVDSKVNLTLDLVGADFYELGFTAKPTRAKMMLTADFRGNAEEFDLMTAIKDGILVYDTKSYPLGTLNLDAKIREDSSSVDIASKILNGFLRTNTNPTDLSTALQGHFRHYLDATDSVHENTQKDIVMNLDLAISEDPLLRDVLLQGLEQFDSARIQADYFQEIDSLTATINFPYVNYSGTEVDSLGLRIRSNENVLRLYLGFAHLDSGPLNMDKTFLTGQLADSRLYFDFHSYEEDERKYHVSSDIGLKGDTLSYHISSIDLMLKGEEWQIPEENHVTYSGESLEFSDFTFSKGPQEVSLVNNIEGFTDENIAILFNDFRLSTITSLLNPQEIVAGGKMDGRLVVENPFGATGILGELKVDSLKVLAVPLGNLSLDASAKQLGDYVLGLSLKDDGVDLDLNGTFMASESGGNFDIQLDLNKIDMEKIAALSGDQLRDAAGYLAGTVTLNGKTTDPRYEGDFQFHEASFVPAQLSTKYLLSNESIRVDNEGVYLDGFTVRDMDGNTFIIDGTVMTESYVNPTFDLKLTAKNFMVINSSDEDADLFYGKGVIDADVSIEGDLTLPVVNAKLHVQDNTDLTIIIPESQVDLVEREGVVVFVNKKDPDDILTRKMEETTDVFSGYDISAVLSVDPKAVFTIVIDEASGDNLAISGEANLSMDINPNGRITLSGTYEVNNGHYEMSLYNLVSRRFEIANGGRITWNGDPMDATMDLQAIYKIDTSPSELMSSQLSGSSSDTRSQYSQKLDFLVYLNVDGELLKPEISFTLDMPEDARGAFGGNVYSRVMQINEQEDELNKQVFSLLVLNRFFPSTGSDGSNGGAEAIARNSVSQLLSDQLNALSSKLFGNSGLSVGFDVDSYQDYQGGGSQNRTELNINAQQRLFDDRLIVQVGSQVDLEGTPASESSGNSILANISFEYMLTEDGRWRIRAFRKNQFESIIDGQLIITGAGLIFNREFNFFRNLWKPEESADEEVSTNPIEEIEQKNDEKNEKRRLKKEEREKAKADKKTGKDED